MPKVLIDIDESDYRESKSAVEIGFCTDLQEAVVNGIILDGLTNGEVFLKLNETAQVYGIDRERDIIDVCFDNENIVPISYSWWNRKWGETE